MAQSEELINRATDLLTKRGLALAEALELASITKMLSSGGEVDEGLLHIRVHDVDIEVWEPKIKGDEWWQVVKASYLIDGDYNEILLWKGRAVVFVNEPQWMRGTFVLEGPEADAVARLIGCDWLWGCRAAEVEVAVAWADEVVGAEVVNSRNAVFSTSSASIVAAEDAAYEVTSDSITRLSNSVGDALRSMFVIPTND